MLFQSIDSARRRLTGRASPRRVFGAEGDRDQKDGCGGPSVRPTPPNAGGAAGGLAACRGGLQGCPRVASARDVGGAAVDHHGRAKPSSLRPRLLSRGDSRCCPQRVSGRAAGGAADVLERLSPIAAPGFYARRRDSITCRPSFAVAFEHRLAHRAQAVEQRHPPSVRERVLRQLSGRVCWSRPQPRSFGAGPGAWAADGDERLATPPRLLDPRRAVVGAAPTPRSSRHGSAAVTGPDVEPDVLAPATGRGHVGCRAEVAAADPAGAAGRGSKTSAVHGTGARIANVPGVC